MADTVRATTIPNCSSGIISQTEYWNMKKNGSQYYGYWQNEQDLQNVLRLGLNGSVLVSSHFFVERSLLALTEREIGLEINTNITRINKFYEFLLVLKYVCVMLLLFEILSPSKSQVN